jgi:uncharacterized DUF497 family protein
MFEFDPAKSAANLAKHGIDFEAAQALWTDDLRLVVGWIDGNVWTAVVTMRGEATRIISVRRSREEEVRRYEHQDD